MPRFPGRRPVAPCKAVRRPCVKVRYASSALPLDAAWTAFTARRDGDRPGSRGQAEAEPCRTANPERQKDRKAERQGASRSLSTKLNPVFCRRPHLLKSALARVFSQPGNPGGASGEKVEPRPIPKPQIPDPPNTPFPPEEANEMRARSAPLIPGLRSAKRTRTKNKKPQGGHHAAVRNPQSESQADPKTRKAILGSR